MRDSRLFVDVMKGNSYLSPSVKIPLKTINQNSTWLSNVVAIGEVRDFDTICNFPSANAMEGNDIFEIKYFGGVFVALKLLMGRVFEVFKANKNHRSKWLNRLDLARKNIVRFEIIAWIKITCLPISSREEANFDIIANNFRKILVHSKSFCSNNDISHGNSTFLLAHVQNVTRRSWLILMVHVSRLESFRLTIIGSLSNPLLRQNIHNQKATRTTETTSLIRG